MTHTATTFSISVSGATEYPCKVTPPNNDLGDSQPFTFTDKTSVDLQVGEITASHGTGYSGGGTITPGEVYPVYADLGSDWTIEGPNGGCLVNLEITAGGGHATVS